MTLLHFQHRPPKNPRFSWTTWTVKFFLNFDFVNPLFIHKLVNNTTFQNLVLWTILKVFRGSTIYTTNLTVHTVEFFALSTMQDSFKRLFFGHNLRTSLRRLYTAALGFLLRVLPRFFDQVGHETRYARI